MKPTPGLVTTPGSSISYETGGWRTQRPRFLGETCTGCNLCVLFCPEGIVFQVAAKTYDFDLAFCKGCGICAAECPVKDVVMEDEAR
ncbi:MAG TPA: 4Fe-4S binding protein [Actinomycetota bacterium]